MRRVFIGATVVVTAAAGGVLALADAALAAQSWTIGSSPVSAQVTLTDSGGLTFAVAHQGGTVLSPSQLGIVTGAADLTRGLSFRDRTDRTATESYTMTTGKQVTRDETYSEATLSFTGAGGNRLDLVVRVGREGAAYRYVLPNSGTVRVEREASSWTVPTGAAAWLNDYGLDYQGPWRQTTAGSAPARDYAYPALFRVNNSYVSIAETAVDGRYTASRLVHSAGSGTYTTELESEVTSSGPLATAWRVAAVGDLATITTNRLVDDLAPPSRIGDTSWIKPGNVAWSWLTEPGSPSSASRQRQYIDFAQRHGWSAVLIDEGWDASWVPDVVKYARDRGVGIILWFNSDRLQTAAQRQVLNQVRDWGAIGVKIDYVWDHPQRTLQWFDTVLAQTAQLRLMVNFHGTEMTRGMQRTWPHVMTSEAVYGAEQKENNAAFNTILPFTRNTVSSMDYTPVTFSVGGRDTTNGHELGTALVFESGWQHLADNPESYARYPDALALLDKLPAAWDETRLLGGAPGQEAYLARRSGGTWYLGGISAVAAKTFSTPLTFLGNGQWFVEIVRDGANGAFARDTVTATSSNTLNVPVATRGGFLAVACPYTAGMTACGKPGNPAPETNLALNRPTRAADSCNADETPDKAVNGSVSGGNSDKWCSGAPGVKTLDVDLGTNRAIKRVVVRHAGAGGENTDWNTRDFAIETSADGTTWAAAATVTGNTASVTTHTVSATTRWVRLSVGDDVARIYELEVYG